MRWPGWLLALAVAAPVTAQVDKPPAPASAAASGAVSERVRRQASDPMRLILDASRIKRRAGEPQEGEAAAAPAAKAAAKAAPPAARPPPAPPPPPRQAAPATTSPAEAVGTPAALTPTVATGVPPAAPDVVAPPPLLPPAAVVAAPPVSAPALLPQAAPTPSAPAAVPASGAVADIATPGIATPGTPAPLSGLPRLLTTVAPEFPATVLRRVGTITELSVQVTINRDGSVSDIRVVAPAYRALEPYVVEALSQWRFEPVSEPLARRLQLVFTE